MLQERQVSWRPFEPRFQRTDPLAAASRLLPPVMVVKSTILTPTTKSQKVTTTVLLVAFRVIWPASPAVLARLPTIGEQMARESHDLVRYVQPGLIPPSTAVQAMVVTCRLKECTRC